MYFSDTHLFLNKRFLYIFLIISGAVNAGQKPRVTNVFLFQKPKIKYKRIITSSLYAYRCI